MKPKTLEILKKEQAEKCRKCIWSKDVGGKLVCLFPKCIMGLAKWR